MSADTEVVRVVDGSAGRPAVASLDRQNVKRKADVLNSRHIIRKPHHRHPSRRR
ncbi:MAG: hypothetical protein J2P50_14950 [Hyphomicrobiaceae bacterium]|nr:hypothetical protein [Hyphomicrobiaceae bacterium]